ncbi:hypothetical protein EIP91_003210 [Steccherinum ochraceum]|uniref:Ataxin-10 homolog n=1 Tax=Steccherinum ochraceum TaxID=92696 RepID=A0A4V2MXY5_9APHY|nr:hypothetical protein EIP91_003210 [Steccherinum ochraceum]
MSSSIRLDAVSSTSNNNSLALPLIDLLNLVSKDIAVPDDQVLSHTQPLIDQLDDLAKKLARDPELRVSVGNADPSVWPPLSRLWDALGSAHNASDEERVLALPLPVTRMLIQTLSNLVTGNVRLTKRVWTKYMESTVEDSVLIRLLGVADESTVLATMVFVLNSVHSSREHLYAIVSRLIEAGLVPELYQKISVADEVVTPHQTTLLKLLDSYLHSTRRSKQAAGLSHALCDMLVSCFFTLSSNAQQSIRRAIGVDANRIPSAGEFVATHPLGKGPNVGATQSGIAHDSHADGSSSSSLQEVDLILPKICEALILTTQCLISLTLQAEDDGKTIHGASAPVERREDVLRTTDGSKSLKEYVSIALSPSGGGFIETLIETLQLFDLFLPRITFGKPAPPPVYAVGGGGDPGQTAQGSSAPPPSVNDERADGHVAGSSATKMLSADPKGFSYLKRDLVRLLGVLTYQSRQVQDRIRGCGGIPVVLNLCVVDDRNPYLREHALFALRNLLDQNPENQAMVNEIQPVREWDMDGQLGERPRI